MLWSSADTTGRTSHRTNLRSPKPTRQEIILRVKLYGGFQQLKIIKFRKVLRERSSWRGVRITLLHLIYQVKWLLRAFITDLHKTTKNVANCYFPASRPVQATKADSLFPPRDLSKSRSLSPARPPHLPPGPVAAPSKLGSLQKKSCADPRPGGAGGAAKLFEKAAELRSSLDVPSFRVPIVRDGDCPDSVSLPSSPMGSRKIGLSYLTPPTSRKLGSCLSPSPDIQLTKPGEKEQEVKPGPFTSVLKSGGLGESLHLESKERGGERISRHDTPGLLLSPGSGGDKEKRRGVSPTPLNNLKMVTNTSPASSKGKK